MPRIIINAYTFNVAAKTISMGELGGALQLERIVRVLDVTTGRVLFDAQDLTQPPMGSATSTTLTLRTDLSGCANTDKLQIIYELPAFSSWYSGATKVTALRTVKANNARLSTLTATNNDTSVTWLQIFNTSAVTLGTTVPVLSYAVPANGTISVTFPETQYLGGSAYAIAATTAELGATVATTGLSVVTSYV